MQFKKFFLITTLISLKDVDCSAIKLQFGYGKEEFRSEIVREALETTSFLKFDPFCKTIMKEIVSGTNQQINRFFDFIFEDFEHEMKNFDMKLSQSWDVFINLAFFAFTQIHQTIAKDILENLILEAYPILDEIRIRDDLMISKCLDELVVKVFKEKLLLIKSHGKDSNEYKTLLLNAKKSAGGFDDSFKYHYAFLNRIPIEEIKYDDILLIDEVNDIEAFLAKLAQKVYDSLLLTDHHIRTKLTLARIYPAVFDEMFDENSSTYDSIINCYTKRFGEMSGTVIQLTPAFHKELVRELPNNQRTLFDLVVSIQREHRLIRRLASKLLENYQNTLNVDDWKQFLIYLGMKLNEIYPEEVERFGIKVDNEIVVPSDFSLNNGWIELIERGQGVANEKIFLAASTTGRLSLALLFVSNPQIISSTIFEKAILKAYKRSNQSVVEVLLKYSLNFTESLEIAAQSNKLEVFKYIYDNSGLAGLQSTIPVLRSSFIFAFIKGNYDIVNYITNLFPSSFNKERFCEIVIEELSDIMTV